MLTLREAYHDYRKSREGELSPKSLHWTEQKVNLHLADLLDTRLDEITPRVARDLHEKLSRTSGRYSANGVARVLKAIINDASRTLDLPTNPVSRGVRMNRESPAELNVAMEDLPAIWAQIDGLTSNVKRVAWTTLMLTGLRSHDVRSMRWASISDNGVLHVPSPKGGKSKAFHLPLSVHVLRELDTLPQSSEWVFPSRSGGYVRDMRRGSVDCNPHAFRRLFRTVCAEVGVDLTMAKVLLNHSMGGDISLRYVSKAHLLPAMKEAAEKVAARLVSFRGRR